jgi:hypothetical protein
LIIKVKKLIGRFSSAPTRHNRGDFNMDDQISVVIMALAILVMLYSVWLAISLRAKVPGGVVGRSWRILMVLVGFFGIGYVVIPFLGDLPQSTMRFMVSLIFFFGAIYVAVTIRLLYRVIEELSA